MPRTPLFTFLLLCLGACRKDPALWDIHNLSGDKVMVFGHGGMGYRSSLPMNSQASLCRSLASGADGTEMDLQLTGDSVLIVFHDKQLEDATTCSGGVTGKAATELNNCKYRKDGKKHAVISADEFFSSCPGDAHQVFTLDCKLAPGQNGVFARALVALLTSHGLQQRCLVESLDPAFLLEVKASSQSLKTYLYCNDYRQAVELKDAFELDGLTIDMDKINGQQVEEAHAAGLKVTVFNASTEAGNIRALQLSPDHIQTDRLEHLLDVYVKRRN